MKISVTPVGVPLGTMAENIKAELKDVDIPSGVMMHIGGTYEDQQESFANIGLLLLAVIVLVYIVMASQFESSGNMDSILFAISKDFELGLLTCVEVQPITKKIVRIKNECIRNFKQFGINMGSSVIAG